jgi:hypothetical protein
MARSISPLPLLENYAFEPFLDFGKPYPTKSFSLDSSIGGHDGKKRVIFYVPAPVAASRFNTRI